MEESQLQNLSPKVLLSIIENLSKTTFRFDYQNLNSTQIEGNMDILDFYTKFFNGKESEVLDVEFICKIYEMNELDKIPIEEFKKSSGLTLLIPTPEEIRFIWTVYGNMTLKEDYEHQTTSYDRNYVRKSLQITFYDESPSDGKLVDSEYTDYEYDSDQITQIL